MLVTLQICKFCSYLIVYRYRLGWVWIHVLIQNVLLFFFLKEAYSLTQFPNVYRHMGAVRVNIIFMLQIASVRLERRFFTLRNPKEIYMYTANTEIKQPWEKKNIKKMKNKGSCMNLWKCIWVRQLQIYSPCLSVLFRMQTSNKMRDHWLSSFPMCHSFIFNLYRHHKLIKSKGSQSPFLAIETD